MNVSISQAKAQLDELVRSAEAGEEVILTERGRPGARLAPASKAVAMPELPPDLALAANACWT
jgi:prevent-host-death family protein